MLLARDWMLYRLWIDGIGLRNCDNPKLDVWYHLTDRFLTRWYYVHHQWSGGSRQIGMTPMMLVKHGSVERG